MPIGDGLRAALVSLLAVSQDIDPRLVATCVLHDPPTREAMHSRMARCLGRSNWQPPPVPEPVAQHSEDWGGWDPNGANPWGSQEQDSFSSESPGRWPNDAEGQGGRSELGLHAEDEGEGC